MVIELVHLAFLSTELCNCACALLPLFLKQYMHSRCHERTETPQISDIHSQVYNTTKLFVWADFSSCTLDKRPFKRAEHKRVMCCANAKANYWGEKWKTNVKMSRIPRTRLFLQDFWHLSEAKSYRSASLHTFHIRTMAARFKWQVLLSPLGQNPFQQYLNSLDLL